jgi:hypothetical protein
VVDIFIGKMTWYQNYIKVFEPIDTVSTYFNMKAWLDDEQPHDDESEDVWGILQSSYSMEDIRKWLNNDGTA